MDDVQNTEIYEALRLAGPSKTGVSEEKLSQTEIK